MNSPILAVASEQVWLAIISGIVAVILAIITGVFSKVKHISFLVNSASTAQKEVIKTAEAANQALREANEVLRASNADFKLIIASLAPAALQRTQIKDAEEPVPVEIVGPNPVPVTNQRAPKTKPR